MHSSPELCGPDRRNIRQIRYVIREKFVEPERLPASVGPGASKIKHAEHQEKIASASPECPFGGSGEAIESSEYHAHGRHEIVALAARREQRSRRVNISPTPNLARRPKSDDS
jgi:hypothetical protein